MDDEVRARLRQRHLYARISPPHLLGRGERVGIAAETGHIAVRWGETEVVRGAVVGVGRWTPAGLVLEGGHAEDPHARGAAEAMDLADAVAQSARLAVAHDWHGIWPQPTRDGARLWGVRLTHHHGEPLPWGPPGPWCSCCGRSSPVVGPLHAGAEGALCAGCRAHVVDLFDLGADPVPAVPCTLCGQVRAPRRQVAFAVVCGACGAGPRD